MRVSVTEAKGQLTELGRRAEAGDEVILTRHGHAAVRLVPVNIARDKKSRRDLLDTVRLSAAAKATAGPSAERSQDFLYDGDGLPGKCTAAIDRPSRRHSEKARPIWRPF